MKMNKIVQWCHALADTYTYQQISRLPEGTVTLAPSNNPARKMELYEGGFLHETHGRMSPSMIVEFEHRNQTYTVEWQPNGETCVKCA